MLNSDKFIEYVFWNINTKDDNLSIQGKVQGVLILQ